MTRHSSSSRDCPVEWRPPSLPRLHYEALYRGLPEYMRAPPTVAARDEAVKYLRALRPGADWRHNPLQRDRVAWSRLWIAACPPCDDDSDADTVDASSAAAPLLW